MNKQWLIKLSKVITNLSTDGQCVGRAYAITTNQEAIVPVVVEMDVSAETECKDAFNVGMNMCAVRLNFRSLGYNINRTPIGTDIRE